MKAFVVLLFVICFWPYSLICQRFDYYPLYKKGPGPACQAIDQDSHGFMWIATSDGLVRFDGSLEKWYQHTPGDSTSLPMNIVNDLTISTDGRVYIRTMWIPLYYLDPSTNHFQEVHDPTFLAETGIDVRQEWVEDLLAVGADSLWFGNNHLILFHANEGRMELIPPPEKLALRNNNNWRVRKIIQDKFDPNYLWILGVGTVTHFNQHTHESTVFETTAGVNNCWGDELFNGIFQEDKNTLWLTAWGGGLTKYNRSANRFDQFHFQDREFNDYTSNIAFDVLPKSDHEFWVSTNLGLYTFNVNQSNFTFYEPNPYDVNPGPVHPTRDLYRDFEGNIWIGSRQGIYKIDRVKNQVRRLPVINDLNPNIITTTAIAGLYHDKLITGMGNGDGVVVYNLQTGERTTYSPPELHDSKQHTVVITSGIETENGTFLFSSTRGLLEFDPREEKLQKWRALPNNHIKRGWDLFEDSRNNIWLSGKGFRCVNPRNGTVIELGQGPEERKLVDVSWNQGIGEDPKGRIWLSSRFGVNVFDYSTLAVTRYPAKDHQWLTVPDITDLVVDQQGYLWVAIRGEGLVRTHTDNPGKEVTYFTKEDGLHSNTISALFIDKHNRIYAGGVSGLSILKIVEDSIMVATMDQTDFLMSPSVNHTEIRELFDGRIAMPDELNGILIFDPEIAFKPDIPPTEIYIDHVTVRDAPLDGVNCYTTPQELTIKEKDSDINIWVGHLAFTLPEKIECRYRLTPLHDDWRKLSQQNIRFSFLPHGDYKLEIQSRYPGQNWGTPLLLKLNILPAFYQTTWFILLCILVMFLLLAAALRWRVQSIRNQEELKTQFNTQLAEVEMQALRAQMNPHFLFNCLNSINGFILKNNVEEASDYLTKFSRLMRLILQNSKSSMVPIEQELEALQLYVHMESARVNNGFIFELRIAPEVETDFIEVPPLILQPFVENAIWHGIKDLPYGEGRLLVEIKIKDGVLHCIVEDNGIGRNASSIVSQKAAKKHKSMGMQITSERLSLADYLNETQTSVEIEDLTKKGIPCGTRVNIRIQLNHD